MPPVGDHVLHPTPPDWSHVPLAPAIPGIAALVPHPPPPMARDGEGTAALPHPAPLPMPLGDVADPGGGIGVNELTSHEGSQEGGAAPPAHPDR